MKRSYTKKQIKEAIDHWTKVLESMDSTNESTGDISLFNELITQMSSSNDNFLVIRDYAGNWVCAPLNMLDDVDTRTIVDKDTGKEHKLIEANFDGQLLFEPKFQGSPKKLKFSDYYYDNKL